jgi:hypothetical protein
LCSGASQQIDGLRFKLVDSIHFARSIEGMFQAIERCSQA